MSQETELHRFDADIEEAAKLVDLHVRDFVRLLALKFLVGVIIRSPVDTGRFRGSWRIGIGEADGSVNAEGGSKEEPQAIERGETGKLSRYDGRSKVYITNSLPYAVRLEEGWSDQAPKGMVAITIAELEAEIASIM